MRFLKFILVVITILSISVAIFVLWIVRPSLSAGTQSISMVTPQGTSSPLHYNQLVEHVAPRSGTTIEVRWDSMGQKLIEAGAINFEKFEELYGDFSEEQLAILQGDELNSITFTPQNIQFWTNVLWSMGLTQESKVLSEGPMKQQESEVPLEYYASMGGWTLGSKSATELYNSTRLVELTPEQDALVYRVAENVFRPCCGNHTAYPDCNHGMAVLGLLELMASQGADEEQLYEAALIFNSYAFTDTYVSIAAYFAMQDIPWVEVDSKQVAGAEFASSWGARNVITQVGPIPGSSYQSSSCSA